MRGPAGVGTGMWGRNIKTDDELIFDGFLLDRLGKKKSGKRKKTKTKNKKTKRQKDKINGA